MTLVNGGMRVTLGFQTVLTGSEIEEEQMPSLGNEPIPCGEFPIMACNLGAYHQLLAENIKLKEPDVPATVCSGGRWHYNGQDGRATSAFYPEKAVLEDKSNDLPIKPPWQYSGKMHCWSPNLRDRWPAA